MQLYIHFCTVQYVSTSFSRKIFRNTWAFMPNHHLELLKGAKKKATNPYNQPNQPTHTTDLYNQPTKRIAWHTSESQVPSAPSSGKRSTVVADMAKRSARKWSKAVPRLGSPSWEKPRAGCSSIGFRRLVKQQGCDPLWIVSCEKLDLTRSLNWKIVAFFSSMEEPWTKFGTFHLQCPESGTMFVHFPVPSLIRVRIKPRV